MTRLPLDLFLRAANGVRKVAAGLRPFSESVWPGVRNDLFVAHDSIYAFASRHVAGRRVLDAGCGTGYGAARLAAAGAASVTGVDLDPANVRFAIRHYATAGIAFTRGDLEHLDYPPASFEFVIASNSLEHLHDPPAFVSGLSTWLSAGGVAIVAIPPILSSADFAVHEKIAYHRSNLTVDQWHSLFSAAAFSIACFSHRATGGVHPDFSSRRASRLRIDDFEFVPTDLAGLRSAPSITAVFELRTAEK